MELVLTLSKGNIKWEKIIHDNHELLKHQDMVHYNSTHISTTTYSLSNDPFIFFLTLDICPVRQRTMLRISQGLLPFATDVLYSFRVRIVSAHNDCSVGSSGNREQIFMSEVALEMNESCK